ncbi:DUF5819 family protein [Streptomyces sp. SID3343]|uniref:DUF5819 family protein n=1 Tax=Streptomyces sp. SID3343 TaxID=2690260 RepID=UPI00136B255C|nr:DUF5819 family protein [Streptomyces sp. SID3343]MYW01835.1 hypothetical protein [Streptomyces sp. SID3343]
MQPHDDAVPGEPVGRSTPPTLTKQAVEDADTSTAQAPGEPAAESSAETPAGTSGEPEERHSTSVRIMSAIIALIVVGATVVHVSAVFLHVAPSNTVSTQYREEIDGYIYPFFEQNWALFAPNPVAENFRLQAQSRVRNPDGTTTDSGWTDLTGDDLDHIRHNPYPSKADQNMIRRAWSTYSDSHDVKDESNTTSRGDLMRDYLRRIVVHRFQDRGRGRSLVSVQVRVVTTPIGKPDATARSQPSIRTLGWWETHPDDFR